VLVVADHPRSEPVAEEMAPTLVPLVEPLRVAAVQPVHPVGEPPQLRLDDEVEVIAHQTEGVHLPPVSGHDGGEVREEREPVLVVEEDRSPRDAARRDVVDRAGELRAERPGHPPNGTARPATAVCQISKQGQTRV